jgi:hypothetical protein
VIVETSKSGARVAAPGLCIGLRYTILFKLTASYLQRCILRATLAFPRFQIALIGGFRSA